MAIAYQRIVRPLPVQRADPRHLGRATSFLTIVAFVSVVALLSYRAVGNLNVAGRPDDTHWVLQDFRDAVYYPAVAFLDGSNPYAVNVFMQRYPVGHPLPLYLPLSLIIHLPFAVLPFASAEFAYYVLTVLLTLVLARFTLKCCDLSLRTSHVFVLAALILLSRPGQMNLLLGQVTLQCVIATYVALHYGRSRPWLAGLGLAVSTFKPTFGIPLAVLMLCRGDRRAVVIGLGVAGVVSAGAAAVLVRVAGGVAPLVASMLASHRGFTAQSFNNPLSGPFRVDTPSLIARLLSADVSGVAELAIGLAVLSVGAFAVRRVAESEGEAAGMRPISATLSCLSVLACTYHQTYDWLLLTLPVTALAADLWIPCRAAQPLLRWALLGVLLLPAVNYLATATAIERLHIGAGCARAVTSLNAVAVLLGFALYAWLALRSRRVAAARSIRP